MSTLNLYNVQKANFWNELLKKEQLQELKGVSAVKAIRNGAHNSDSPVSPKGELLPGRKLERAPVSPVDAKRPGLRSHIVRMSPMIPSVSGPQYQNLKNHFRPQTAPVQRSGENSKHSSDPRFASQVGPKLFGFSDIQKTFPLRRAFEKASEYGGSHGDYQDAMTVHERRRNHPIQIYTRPTTASQDIGWNAFDNEYYANRNRNRSLIHPLKSSPMTKFAHAMAMCGR